MVKSKKVTEKTTPRTLTYSNEDEEISERQNEENRANESDSEQDENFEQNEDSSESESESEVEEQSPKTQTRKLKNAGLKAFRPFIFHQKLKAGRYAKVIQKSAGVMMAGVLEYLCEEVLDIAQEVTKNRKKVRITPRDLMMSIRNDAELDKLLKDVTFPQSGVRPNINHALLSTQNQRKRKAAEPKPNEITSGPSGHQVKKKKLNVARKKPLAQSTQLFDNDSDSD